MPKPSDWSDLRVAATGPSTRAHPSATASATRVHSASGKAGRLAARRLIQMGCSSSTAAGSRRQEGAKAAKSTSGEASRVPL